jgi:acyl carrier protein
MDTTNDLNKHIKQMMVRDLMLQIAPEEIADDQPLFGPGSLGLDSVDALQLVVGLDKQFGLKIPDPATARQVLATVSTIAAAVADLSPTIRRVECGGVYLPARTEQADWHQSAI